MPDPNKLAAASAFNSFKQFDAESTSVTISGNVGGGVGSNFVLFSSTVPLDYANISYQVYMTSTLQSTRRYSLVGGLAPIRTGSINAPGPTPVPYNVFFSFAYVSTTLTCTAFVFNPYGITMDLQTETITFYIRPFVSPF